MILYRSFLLCVVALWATMWVLLIRSELQPESTGLRAIPVEHVLREAFRVEKDSDLWISNGPTHIGSLRLTPKTDPTEGTRTLNFSGRVTVTLPDGGSQRPGWMGELTMKPDWAVQYFHLTTITREYSPVLGGSPMRSTEVELELRPPIHRGWYVVRVGPEVMDHHEFSLDEVGLSQLLSHLGIDESTLKQFPATKGRSAGDHRAGGRSYGGAGRKAGDLPGDGDPERADAAGGAAEPARRSAACTDLDRMDAGAGTIEGH